MENQIVEEKPLLFSIGLVTDVQYADKNDDILPDAKKYYREALTKLSKCIDSFNEKNLEFVVHLGDLIDGNINLEKTKIDLEETIKVLSKSTKKFHYIIGNHCLSVPRDHLFERLKIKQSYYDLVIKGWRFLFLDGSDISVYGWPENSPNHKEAKKIFRKSFPG